ncbi:MAG: DUF935 family protein [Rhodoblastus sp.]
MSKKRRRQPAAEAAFAAQAVAISNTGGPPPASPIIQMIANPQNDITIPHYSRVLRPTDETLLHRGGGKGIALYREVLKDGRSYTVLQKRKRKLVAREWAIEPASDARVDRKAAKIVEEQFKALSPDRVALGLLDATLMGFAISEVEWARDGARIVARSVKNHDQRRFVFGPDGEPRLLTWDQMAEGIELPPGKFIVHRFEELSSDPYGWGLGRILFWHVLFKREGVAFWMKALERFATPMPVAKYPIGSLPQQQQALIDALEGAIVNGALVVPAGTDINFAQAAVSGTLTHESWCRYWDEQTAETVLGQTLSTNIGSVGSKAAADSHKETEDALIDGDSDLLGSTLRETLFDWITAYNCADGEPPIVKWKRAVNVKDEADAEASRADAQAKQLANMRSVKGQGWKPVDEQGEVARIMGFDVETAPPPAPAILPGLPGGPSLQPGAKAPAPFADQEGDLADDVDLLDDAAQPEIDKWLDAIRAVIADLVDEGGTLADLPHRLLTLYPDLDTKRMTRLIGAALTNADLRGRADALDEAGE